MRCQFHGFAAPDRGEREDRDVHLRVDRGPPVFGVPPGAGLAFPGQLLFEPAAIGGSGPG